jgi:hypothetical protein
MTDLSQHGHRRIDGGVADAARSGLGFAAAGMAFFVLAGLWLSTCSGATVDPLACGVPQRAALALGAPVILAFGGVWSLARLMRMRRDEPAWWAWLGASWLLFALAVLALYGASLP